MVVLAEFNSSPIEWSSSAVCVWPLLHPPPVELLPPVSKDGSELEEPKQEKKIH